MTSDTHSLIGEPSMTDKLEFYDGDNPHPFLTLDSAFQPNKGDLMNIRGVTWKALGRSFTVDHAGKIGQSIRCNVILKRQKRTDDRGTAE